MRKANKKPDPKYLFQRRKASFFKKVFKKGLNASAYILFAAKDFGGTFSQNFIEEFPNNYQGLYLLKIIFGYDSKKRFRKNTIQVNISRLKKEGLIAENKNKKFYLTNKGEEMILYIKDRYSILEKPWDKKIRIVIFDIPERKKHLREWLRAELGLLMFRPLQKSVYIGKYPLPNDLYQDLIKNELFNNVHIFTVDKADKQEELIKLLEK